MNNPLLVLVLLSASSPLQAQLVRLTPDMARGPSHGNLIQFEASPDGSRVVFLSDLLTPGAADLFSMPADGSAAPIALDGGDNPTHFRITPDGTRVVYATNEWITVVPIGGGAKTTHYTGSSADLVYIGNTHAIYQIWFLYSVPLDGSAGAVARDLGGPEVLAAKAAGNRVVLLKNEFSPELYSLSVDGSDAALLLAEDLPFSADWTDNFKISPDGTRVLFGADNRFGKNLLYSRRVDGSQPSVALNPDVAAGSVPYVIEISPDGSRVAFNAANPTVHPNSEFYTAPIDGSSPAVRLAPTLRYPSFTVPPKGLLQYSPDSRNVFFIALSDLYVTAADGSGTPTRLTSMNGRVWSFRLAPDASRIVFRASDGTSVVELLGIPVGGGVPTRFLPSVEVLEPFWITENSSHVVFRSNTQELFSAPLNTSATASSLSSGVLGQVHDSEPRRVELLGSKVLYCGYPTEVEEDLLYLQEIGSPPLALTPAYDPGDSLGSVREFQVMKDGQHAVFIGDLDRWRQHELYAVELSPPYEIVKLASAPVSSFVPTPDGLRILYRDSVPSLGTDGLYSVLLDGSAAPIQLNSRALSSDSAVEFTTDGARVLYEDRDALFIVPVDGSAPTQAVYTPAPRPTEFKVNPDGLSVVYAQGSQNLLYRLLLSRTQPPLNLIGNLASDRSLVPDDASHYFSLSPDGRFAVFSGDLISNDRIDLFSVPTDGSTPPVLLAAMDHAGASLSQTYKISPDGTRVVFRADAEVDERYELYSVPIAGGPRVKLTPPRPGADVRNAYEFAPDNSLIYMANPISLGVNDLFRVPVDGSGPPARISMPPSTGVGLLPPTVLGNEPFTIDPFHERVVYYSNLESGSGYRLLSSEIHGTGPTFQIAQQRFDFTFSDLSRLKTLVEGGNVLYLHDTGLFRVSSSPGAPAARVTPGDDARSVDDYARPQGPTVFTGRFHNLQSTELYLFRLDPPPQGVKPR